MILIFRPVLEDNAKTQLFMYWQNCLPFFLVYNIKFIYMYPLITIAWLLKADISGSTLLSCRTDSGKSLSLFGAQFSHLQQRRLNGTISKTHCFVFLSCILSHDLVPVSQFNSTIPANHAPRERITQTYSLSGSWAKERGTNTKLILTWHFKCLSFYSL